MEKAPFFADVDEGPEGGEAHWLVTSDGIRVRVGHWNASADKGTVLLFPGRTEYVEKYGRAAQDLAARGYATIAIDWRGQGLADRLVDDVRIGHVGEFTDYQKDVAAMVEAAKALDLPRPWYLVAHSMGGCIGLRAIMEGLDVNASVFSAPMWGIFLAPSARPAAWALSWGTSMMGLGHFMSPGTSAESYVIAEPFADNKLTTDVDMYEYMRRQTLTHPAVGLGGPSLRWLHKSLIETRCLAARPAPDMPCLTFLGTNERIVDMPRIKQRMASWPNGRLEMVAGAEHEVLMETLPIRSKIFDDAAAFFERNRIPQAKAKSA